MQKVQAIILAASPYSETTLLVQMLTREAGVVRGLAKGARRGQKSQAVFDLLAWVETALSGRSGGERLVTLGETRLRQGWDYLRRDMALQAYAALGIEVLGMLAAESPPESFHFDEGCRFLTYLEHTRGPGSAAIALLLRMMHHAGQYPHLAEPARAGEGRPASWVYEFSSHELRPGTPDDDLTRPGVMRLAAGVIEPLREALRRPPAIEEMPPLGAGQGPDALRWLVRIWEDQLGRPIRSMAFLEEMVLRSR